MNFVRVHLYCRVMNFACLGGLAVCPLILLAVTSSYRRMDAETDLKPNTVNN